MGVVFLAGPIQSALHILPFNLTMRWSPFVTISTILAVTSIFEGVAAAPLDVVREVRVGVKQSIVKRNPPNPPKITVTLGPKGES